MQVAGGGAGEERLLQLLVTEFHDRVQPEHREVQCGGTVHCGARCGDPVEDERGLGDALAAPAVGLGDGDADPAAGSHVGVEVPGELVSFVALGPVRVVVRRAHGVDGLDDQCMVGVGREVHVRDARCSPRGL